MRILRSPFEAVPPVIGLQPGSFVFATVVGQDPQPQILTVTNSGASEEFGFAKNVGEPPFLDALTVTPASIDLSASPSNIASCAK